MRSVKITAQCQAVSIGGENNTSLSPSLGRDFAMGGCRRVSSISFPKKMLVFCFGLNLSAGLWTPSEKLGQGICKVSPVIIKSQARRGLVLIWFSPWAGNTKWDVAAGKKPWCCQWSAVQSACANPVETDLFIYLDVDTYMAAEWVFLSPWLCLYCLYHSGICVVLPAHIRHRSVLPRQILCRNTVWGPP